MSTVTALKKSKQNIAPKAWHERYADADKAKVRRVLRWFDDEANDHSRAHLARAADVNTSTLSQVLGGTYPSHPVNHLRKLIDAMAMIDAREQGHAHAIAFVATSTYKLAEKICDRAREFRDFGVLFGYVGTGKTRALNEYCSRHPGALYMRAFGGLTRSVLMKKLTELTGANVRTQSRYSSGTVADKKEAIITALSGTERLLIVDEANRMVDACFEDLRDISDDAQIGIVMAGTEHLEPMVQDSHGRFGQISSRIGFWPPVIRGITENDAYLITQAAYDSDTLDPEVLDMYWQQCGGSARTLSKLIASVMKYCKRKKCEPSAKIISDCYQKTMRPSRVRALGGVK
ncbi:MAG TPA: hypothetical protein ENI80_03485 [Acidiferrobacteraceae bacterium]|nr:hypothetical protein [Acidiferrobacteraceae bacterium]